MTALVIDAQTKKARQRERDLARSSHIKILSHRRENERERESEREREKERERESRTYVIQ